MSLFFSTRSETNTTTNGDAAALSRTTTAACSFEEAIFANIASDGGLFLPQQHPQIPRDQLRSAAMADDFSALSAIAAAAYDRRLACTPEIYREQIFPFSPRLTMLDEQLALLELYHGPTCAFKDFGASFLAYHMEQKLRKTRERIVILTATSGDTGSAVARAFHRKENIAVVILYPANRISKLQEAHINSFSDNIHSIRIRGTFDDCQALVKQSFCDQHYAGKVTLSSANSINIGRLLPQSFYYHYAFYRAEQEARGRKIHFCVPSGNIGNLTAGVLAWRAGMQAESFIVASNSNRAVPLYLQRGSYKPRRTVRTISNAMDVGNPNNFERLRFLHHNSHAEMTDHISGYWASERETRKSIADTYHRYGVMVDPHTATALSAAAKARARIGDGLIICLSTAHPCKFGDTVRRVLRTPPPFTPQLAHLAESTAAAPNETMPARYSTLREYLLKRFAL